MLVSWLACTGLTLAASLSPLARAPDWNRLEPYQETMTAARFREILEKVYAPNDASRNFIRLEPDRALILKRTGSNDWFTLRFAAAPSALTRPPSTPSPPDKPLAGLTIAIDPGHLGGRWAKTEARWFQINGGTPVVEGDMTLRVARHLAPQLRALGARVALVRDSSIPTTVHRPWTLRGRAASELAKSGGSPSERKIQLESERLFYRTAEIRGRALFVNQQIQPDLTLCLHFNAEAWGSPDRPSTVEKNHFHLLINGAYSAEELALDDVRFDMLVKLLSDTLDKETAMAESVGASVKAATGLPPFTYNGPQAVKIGETGWVWGRNLLANRLYHGAVVFLEPYVMNHPEVIERVQLGDYEGECVVNGVARKSLYREYADAVAEGLRQWAPKTRSPL